MHPTIFSTVVSLRDIRWSGHTLFGGKMELTKPADPVIDPADPWANDDLQRKSEGLLLVRLISSLTGAYVIGVKGGWGTGKSVFLERLAAQLELQSIPVIRINVWRTDYLEDPLIAFTAAAEERLEAERTPTERTLKKGKQIAEALAKHSKVLASPVISTAMNFVAPGTGAVAEVATGPAIDIGRDLLAAVRAQKTAEQKLREELGKARDFLTKRDPLRPPERIAVLIDELDRCRPDYAIKVLERIKHFFDVVGITFVIATDGENLPNAVASVYGPNIDGETYLRKFFDYEFELSTPDPDKFIGVLAQQYGFDSLISNSQTDRKTLHKAIRSPDDNAYVEPVVNRDRALDALEIIEAFPLIAKKLRLSLRDQVQAFTVLNAYLRTLSRGTVVFPGVVTFLCCLRFSTPDLFRALRANQIGLRTILEKHTEKVQEHPGDGWLNSTTIGLEITYFAMAASDSDALKYLQAVWQAAANADPVEDARFTAITRVIERARLKPDGVRSYVSRAASLADAFS